MLRLTPVDQRYALDRAANAKESADTAKNDEDRHFWTQMEARWQGVADTSAFLERLKDYTVK
jgi:hypothetical protein